MRTAYFTRPDITFTQDLTLGALSFTTSINKKVKIEQILIKASVNITETITITLDSVNGANYDVMLRKRSLSAEQNFVYRPEGELNLQAGDKLKIQCTNANTTGILYGILKTAEMGVQ